MIYTAANFYFSKPLSLIQYRPSQYRLPPYRRLFPSPE